MRQSKPVQGAISNIELAVYHLTISIMSRPAHLISKRLDPVLAVFTGLLAFRLHETNPRTAPPPGETLPELLRWKYNRWQLARHGHADGGDDLDLDGILKAVETDAQSQAKK